MKYLNTIVVVVLSIALLMLGYFFHSELMDYSMWQLPNVSFRIIGLEPIGNPLLLLIAIALIPAGYFFLNSTVKMRSLLQVLLYMVFTAACGLCFWWLRILYMQVIVKELRTDPSILPSISIDQLQFEQYSLFGIFTGILISGIALKIVNRKKKVSSVSQKPTDDSLIDQND